MLIDLLACPRCGGALTGDGGAPSCAACGVGYPPLGRVPCLLPDGDRWRALWRAQLAAIHVEADDTLAVFAGELRKPALVPDTRARLERQTAIARQMVADIDAAVADVGPPADEPEPIPGYQPLESLHLLHRDWGWPESDENARALGVVERVLCAPLGRVLVIGAGACRLAYDLHVRHGAVETVALDVDPLALSVAARTIAGERVALTEARSDATDLARLSAPRTLHAPDGPARGLNVVLGDGLAPPLRPHAFDTVVTPWFIDLVPPDGRDLLGVLRRMLAPGGRWLNYGPLLYPLARPPALRFSREEWWALARRAGFEVERTTVETMPYSLSPLTQRGRIEECLAWSARAGELPADRAGEPPSWLVLPWLPVPDFPGRAMFHHENAAFAAIVGLVDGRRAIDDIAAQIAHLTAAPAAALKDTIRYCLAAVHPACNPA